MSPKRKRPPDGLWDRTPGGLIVPRPTLPTRRFIQKMGSGHDCCLSSVWPSCTFCNHHDDTVSLFLDVVATVTYSTYTWTLDGTYELTTKTAGSYHEMGWSDSFTALEDGAGPSRDLLIIVSFTCGADPTPPPLGTSGFFVAVYLKDSGVTKARGDYQTFPFPSYTTPGYDDCVTRYFNDYGTPVALTHTTYYAATGYVGTWGAASIS